jgi:uncharacterized protein
MKNRLTFVIVPGLGNSGPEHWQTYWEKELPGSVRVIQENWENPEKDEWIERLDDTIARYDGGVVLIAHSLAVSLVLHWTERRFRPNVYGALLVSASDVDSVEHTPDIVRGFAPMPLIRLPYPSVVVASEDDPFVSSSRAKYFAGYWGSQFVSIGAKGHLNASSGLRSWEEGKEILQSLINRLNSKPK